MGSAASLVDLQNQLYHMTMENARLQAELSSLRLHSSSPIIWSPFSEASDPFDQHFGATMTTMIAMKKEEDDYYQ